MTKYAALLRGIGPGDPNMRNEKLRGVFEKLGFGNVQSFISSGNILFETDESDTQALEQRIEQALQKDLGINSAAILRSQEDLEYLAGSNMFAGYEHKPETYLTVTFLKHLVEVKPEMLPNPTSKSCVVLGFDAQVRALCVCTDTTTSKTPDTMRWLETILSKDITTRTWATVSRITRKLA